MFCAIASWVKVGEYFYDLDAPEGIVWYTQMTAEHSNEAMIAIEMRDGSVVCVPIIWLMDGGSWTRAYHRNGDPITRHEEGFVFVNSIQRTDIKRILG